MARPNHGEDGTCAIACVREPVVISANQTLLDSAGVTTPDAWTTDVVSLAGELSGRLSRAASSDAHHQRTVPSR